MKVEVDGAVRFLVFGPVKLPLRADPHAVVRDAMKLPPALLEEIVRDAGFETHPETDSRKLLCFALGLVQDAWYKESPPDQSVPENVQRNQETRKWDYLTALGKAKKEPRGPKDAVTGRTKAGKPARCYALKDAAAPSGDRKGVSKALLDALAGGPKTSRELVSALVAAGYSGSTPAPKAVSDALWRLAKGGVIEALDRQMVLLEGRAQ